ncbi:hypothetical protein DENIS_3476 [Desulfonema ishimotonii]|uniref:Uncharacterized protein n=1 Tax=Desulfonema ishimotonii TaxID=45657 RepID=A0A401FZV6_9BACT|nr:phage antirepressor N-terminal domain-containing protein [Desulfonema ishimotonii]GBC62504.1 hypothetical protein DENIS_3476 [Desulfonema ishimotonii]
MNESLVPQPAQQNQAVIDFHGQQLITAEKDGIHYVAMKPIVDGMGLDWSNQLKIIKKDPVLSKGVVNLTIPSGRGIQDTTCLNLRFLNGWLFRVDAGRYAGDDPRRAIIIRYQEECYQVLYDHWHAAETVRDTGTGALTSALRDVLKELRSQEEQRISSLERKVDTLTDYVRSGRAEAKDRCVRPSEKHEDRPGTRTRVLMDDYGDPVEYRPPRKVRWITKRNLPYYRKTCELVRQGYPIPHIVKLVGKHKATIYRWVRKMEEEACEGIPVPSASEGGRHDRSHRALTGLSISSGTSATISARSRMTS